MSAPASLMAAEAADSAQAVERFVARNDPAVTTLAAQLRRTPPAAVVTCARGSSDHAATYGKYLVETYLGIPVASAAPSVASLLHGAITPAAARLCLAISQSGRSPDLVASVEAQIAAGARIAALVNDEASPLLALAEVKLPLSAGPERSVAATKSCVASLAGLALLVARWSGDRDLSAAVAGLPEALRRAWALDWSSALASLTDATGMFVIGRGFGLGIAQEAALKLKETCGIHAEPFSSAEVRHGPMAIVGMGFPVLAFATPDTAGDDVRGAAALFRARGARVILIDAAGGDALPAIAAHPAVAPIAMLLSFYRFVEALARRRGRDPDAPPHLSKVTATR